MKEKPGNAAFVTLRVLCDFSPAKALLRGEKAEDLVHRSVRLIRLEEKLGMGGAIQNNQLFWFGGLLVLCADSGETRSVSAGIVTCHDEQGWGLELVGGAAGRRAEEDHAIDLTGLRGD